VKGKVVWSKNRIFQGNAFITCEDAKWHAFYLVVSGNLFLHMTSILKLY
jgi:hypothetical protein